MDGYQTVQAAIKLLPYGEDKLRRDLRSGKVHGVKISRDWIIANSEVERLREEAMVHAN